MEDIGSLISFIAFIVYMIYTIVGGIADSKKKQKKQAEEPPIIIRRKQKAPQEVFVEPQTQRPKANTVNYPQSKPKRTQQERPQLFDRRPPKRKSNEKVTEASNRLDEYFRKYNEQQKAANKREQARHERAMRAIQAESHSIKKEPDAFEPMTTKKKRKKKKFRFNPKEAILYEIIMDRKYS